MFGMIYYFWTKGLIYCIYDREQLVIKNKIGLKISLILYTLFEPVQIVEDAEMITGKAIFQWLCSSMENNMEVS